METIMAETFERELDWEDEIERESDFILLPEGDYDFTVTTFERARHQGSEKLPPCKKAILTLTIETPEGTANIKHNLFLHTKTEGVLTSFFRSIGQMKHGERLKMNWNTVIGSKGRCKIVIDTWKNSNGDDMKSNKVKRFYDPPASAAANTNTAPAPTGAYVPGKF